MSKQINSMLFDINNTKFSEVVDVWFGFHNPLPSMKVTFLKSHPILSNLHPREFKDWTGRSYVNVEHAYWSWSDGVFHEEIYDMPWIKYLSFGFKERPLPAGDLLNARRSLMKRIIRQSLVQNQTVLTHLLNTGDRLITHRNERNPYWRREFPAILMELRNEMR